MGLSESIEKILQNNNGKLSLEKVFVALNKRYARQTILDYIQNEKDLISSDGENLTLIKYPLQYFIQILENYSRQNGVTRSDVFYLGAFYLYLRRQFPENRTDEIINFRDFGSNNYREEPDIYKLNEISVRLGNDFVQSITDFLNKGWIEKLDSKGFYAFTKEFYEYFISSSGTGRDLYSTPDTLIDLICKIIPDNQPLKVYNPAAGMLKLLTAIKINSEFEVDARASDINQEIHKLGLLFARTNGFNPDYNCINSLEELDYSDRDDFDLIVSILPFKAKVNFQGRYHESYNDVALDLISGSIPKLHVNGTALFLVPDGVLFGDSPNYRRFRMEIIDRRMIHTIVSLPVNLFYPVASVKTSLLIFEKGINHKSVRFIDASSNHFYSINQDKSVSLDVDRIAGLVKIHSSPDSVNEPALEYGIPESLELDFHQLIDEGYSLNLNDYFIKYIQPQESGYLELREFVTLLKLPLSNAVDLPYLRITDLTGSIINEVKGLSKNQSRTRGRILNEEAFLIGTVGGSSKPSWYSSPGQVELSTNIVALKIIPGKAHFEYLLQELNSDYVQKQLAFLSLGSTSLKHLRHEDLLKVKIKLPSFDDQVRISRERIEYLKEHSFSTKKDTATITDIAIFKTINHEIGNILKGPDGFLSLLPQFLERNRINSDVPSSSHKEARTIGERIQSAKDDISKVYQIMANMEGILLAESSYFKPEKTELTGFIRKKLDQLKEHHPFEYYTGNDSNYRNPAHLHAEIDKMQFEHIITNIISNAVNHSETSPDVSLMVLVNLKFNESTIEIHFMNNGDPLPADFGVEDYISFSRKSGKSPGQGIGGFLINKVTTNHNGQISLLPPGVFQVKTKDESFEYKANVDIVITIPQKQ